MVAERSGGLIRRVGAAATVVLAPDRGRGAVRVALAWVASVLLLVASSSPAQALTVGTGKFQGQLDVVASPGEVNHLTIAPVAQRPNTVMLSDTAPIAPGKGCLAGAAGVTCSVPGLYVIQVRLGDGGDTFSAIGLGDVQVTAQGGSGDDEMTGGGGAISFQAGSGDDVLEAIGGGIRRPTFNGGPGDDRLLGAAAGEELSGGEGKDLVAGGPGPDSLSGDGGADRLVGGFGNDGILGGGGADTLVGEAGPDFLFGGSGRDDVRGGPGGDRLEGGRDDDSVLGGPGNDRFQSTKIGSDASSDLLAGGPGGDLLTYLCGSCRVSLDNRRNDGPPGGRDDARVEAVRITSSFFDPDLAGEPGALTVYGSGQDTLTGNANANVLIASRGDDVLRGRAGRDSLFAGGGDDSVLARDGEPDRVVCGKGRDVALLDPLDRQRGCEQVLRG